MQKSLRCKRHAGDGLQNDEASNFFVRAEVVLHFYLRLSGHSLFSLVYFGNFNLGYFEVVVSVYSLNGHF